MSFNTIWPTQPIHNGKDVPLQQQPGTLPNMADTVMNYFQLLVMEKITKTTVNFQLVETTTPIQFQGVVTTEPKRTLRMMPNGQRLWKVKMLYCLPTVLVAPDDIVKYENVQYRVGASVDFKQYGYMMYELLEDYTGSSPTGG